MLIKFPQDIRPSEITPEQVYRQRRQFMLATAGLALAPLAGAAASPRLNFSTGSQYSTDEKKNSREDITQYNNFYEFATDKYTPAERAQQLTVSPWSVTIEGEVKRPGSYTLEDILKSQTLEERIYRLRCVEGWSMVVPWIGFPLAALLKRVEPGSRAKYVEFTTMLRPAEMPGQRSGVLDWPYVEGLRIDEAMHPLTILAVGLYGEVMPKQNGAPIRLVVPWKYGFKSIKSIVKIRLLEKQPVSTWMKAIPSEYGFYATVNPDVDHPRWSQKRERRLGEFIKRATLPFNGYADQVASLYTGMDLKKFF